LYGAGALLLGLYGIIGPFVTPALRRHCLPFVPATTLQTNLVTKHAKQHFEGLRDAVNGSRKGLHDATSPPTSHEPRQFIDLGSGNGRLVLSAARQIDAQLMDAAHGVELNMWLVLYSKYASFRAGLQRRTRFDRKDIFKIDMSQYHVVSIFGVPSLMPDLEKKLGRELRPDGIAIACRFPLPNWKPIKIEDGGGGMQDFDKVWVYSRQSIDCVL